MLVFLFGEHSNNKKLLISVQYLNSSGCMLVFILVAKVWFSLIMSFPARTINKTPFKYSKLGMARLVDYSDDDLSRVIS